MGGGSNAAARQAQENEDARKAQIAQSTAQINALFDNPSRTAQYGQLAKDTTQFYTDDLNRQKAINDRNMRFAQARGGQIGGSVQADQGQQAGQDYLKGVLEAQRRGDAAAAGLRSQDETSRANLIAMAQGGLDATSAASQSASALRSNLQSGMASSTANTLGDMFGDMGKIYQNSQDTKALQRGWTYAGQGLYQPGFGYGGRP